MNGEGQNRVRCHSSCGDDRVESPKSAAVGGAAISTWAFTPLMPKELVPAYDIVNFLIVDNAVHILTLNVSHDISCVVATCISVIASEFHSHSDVVLCHFA